MFNSRWFQISALAALLVSVGGCKQLPGNRKSQGTAIGGVSGAAVGAAVAGSEHRLLGALIGGALGAGGGYVIAAKTDHINNPNSQAAQQAATKAVQSPATAQDAVNATTADLNNDGFVTLDEVVAMKQAALTDETILARLRATEQVFELTDDQKRYLANQGLSGYVINSMALINQEQRQQLLNQQNSVNGRGPTRP